MFTYFVSSYFGEDLVDVLDGVAATPFSLATVVSRIGSASPYMSFEVDIHEVLDPDDLMDLMEGYEDYPDHEELDEIDRAMAVYCA